MNTAAISNPNKLINNVELLKSGTFRDSFIKTDLTNETVTLKLVKPTGNKIIDGFNSCVASPIHFKNTKRLITGQDVELKPLVNQSGAITGYALHNDNDLIRFNHFIIFPDTQVPIRNNMVLNLNTVEGLSQYNLIIQCPDIAPSRDTLSKCKNAMFYIENQQTEAEQEVKAIGKEAKLLARISEMNHKELSDINWALGFATVGQSAEMLAKNLITAVKNRSSAGVNVDQVVAMLNDSASAEKTLFEQAIYYQIIKNTDSGYMFNEHNLGVEKSDVIKYLKTPNKAEIRKSIVARVDEKNKL